MEWSTNSGRGQDDEKRFSIGETSSTKVEVRTFVVTLLGDLNRMSIK